MNKENNKSLTYIAGTFDLNLLEHKHSKTIDH